MSFLQHALPLYRFATQQTFMAGLLQSDTSHNRKSLRPLLVSAAVVALLFIIGSAVYYHLQDHPAVELTGLRSVTVPLHTVYTHGANVVGPDTAEDSTYVLAAVQIRDRASVPLFVKDIIAGLSLPDGSQIELTRIKAKDMDRVVQLVPALGPAMQQIGVPALQPEQTVAPGATVQGYVLLQVNGPETIWKNRKEGTVTIDFYHQDPVTVVLK